MYENSSPLAVSGRGGREREAAGGLRGARPVRARLRRLHLRAGRSVRRTRPPLSPSCPAGRRRPGLGKEDVVRGWGCVPRRLAMAREDSVKCLRCLLYALNLLFWVSAARGAGAGPGAQGGTAPGCPRCPGAGGAALEPLGPCQAAPASTFYWGKMPLETTGK